MFVFDVELLLQSFEGSFDVAKGINRPKIVACRGTDGGRYKQLIKVCCYRILIHHVWLVIMHKYSE